MQIEKREFEDRVVYGYYKGAEFIHHREDGPAIERVNGDEIWYYHGKRHRENGPAEEWTSGSKYWCLHGRLHREDGPAIEFFNKQKLWYLEGEEIKEKDFEEALKIYKVKNLCK